MRVKYVLGKSQGQILDEKKLRNIAHRVKQGESNPVITEGIKKLALNGIGKARPILKDVIKQLLDEYTQSIKEITNEAILELAKHVEETAASRTQDRKLKQRITDILTQKLGLRSLQPDKTAKLI